MTSRPSTVAVGLTGAHAPARRHSTIKLCIVYVDGYLQIRVRVAKFGHSTRITDHQRSTMDGLEASENNPPEQAGDY